jgi:pyruvate,water dikinase
MNYVQIACQATDPAVSGNKAARLADLSGAGFHVPPFFAVGPGAVPDDFGTPGSRVCRQIEAALRRICPDGQPVAVRSSSIEEDGAGSSFAGQFESFLNIAHVDVCEHIVMVRDSACSARVEAYRRERGGTQEAPMPAVLVQRMVAADAAGVAFAADPVSGRREVVTVAATKGLGDALVSGECQGDTWRVDHSGRIIAEELVDDKAALRRRQVRKIAALARAASEHFAWPQDIEWAISRGRIYLLQSRDITTLRPQVVEEDYALWDNSNIVESYGGVTTPLTFSVARSAYAEAYRHFGRVIGFSEHTIRNNKRTYEQMIGLHDGRVYYNLLNWYRLLMLTPGFRFNSRFMEQMMGVTQSLPDEVLPRPHDAGRFAGVRAALGLSRVSWRLLKRHFLHSRRVENFHRELKEALRPVLQGRVIPAWDTPLVNDLFCMIFHGVLRRLCERWLPPQLAGIHNDLVSGEAGIISLEPVRQMKRLAELARRDAGFVAMLRDAPLGEVRRGIEKNTEFSREFEAYLERFGDRCMDELKLESRTVADDPLTLLRTVAHMAGARNARTKARPTQRNTVEAQLHNALGRSPVRRAIFLSVLRLARARLRDRENLRFERTRVYGRVRAIFLEIGKRLEARNVIATADDIFYLDVDEIREFIRGTGSSIALQGIVAARRDEFDEYRDAPDLPRRFVTCGPAQLPESRQPVAAVADTSDESLRRGQGCSPGTVRGPVRIVRDPRNANIEAGDILVAERTDPGWVTIFPLVTGMIMERGSLLSHSAIVARELGLPCVVGVENACDWLEDGEIVEIDGATGVISRANETHVSEQAA